MKGRASYVIDAVTEIFLKKQAHSRSQRWVRSETEFVVSPRVGAPLYHKASQTSDVVGRIPEGKETVAIDFGTPSLCGKYYFWHVFDYTPSEANGFGQFLTGYLLKEDTDAA